MTFRIQALPFTALLIFLMLTISLAGDEDRIQTTSPAHIYPFAFTKIGTDYWGAGGAALTTQNGSSAAWYNPAALNAGRFGAYVESGYRLESDWVYDFKTGNNTIAPSFLSFSARMRNWNFALGYARSYAFKLNDRYPVTTVEHPEGTGEFWEFNLNINKHAFFGAASFRFGNIVSLGLNTALNYMHRFESVYQIEAKGGGFGGQFTMGVLVQPIRVLKIASVFRYTQDIGYDITTKNDNYLEIDSSDGSEYYIKANYESKSQAQFPWIFETGIGYSPLDWLELSGKITYQRWPEVKNYETGYEITFSDRLNYHFGLRLSPVEALSFNFGYFTQRGASAYNRDFYEQQFLTCAMRWKIIRQLSVSLNILDSYLLSTENTEMTFGANQRSFNQTIISAGLGLEL